MEKLRKIKIGKKPNLISLLFLFLITSFTSILGAQSIDTKCLESKAVEYFCEHIKEINIGLVDYKIIFKGYTVDKYSNVYQIANCVKDVNLFKDSIPNKDYLDSLEQFYERKVAEKIKITYKSPYLKRCVFAPFNKYIYTLYAFNAIEYKENYYVEIYLVNNNKSLWTVSIKFNHKTLEPIGYSYSYMIH